MTKRSVLFVMIAMLITIAMGQTAVGAEPAKEYPVTVMVVAASDSAVAPEEVKVNPGNCFKVILYAAAGTGYGWELDSGTLTSIELLERNVVSVSRLPLEGGPAKWEFCLRVKPQGAGPETLHFSLSRPWEKTEKPARMFDLTVVTK